MIKTYSPRIRIRTLKTETLEVDVMTTASHPEAIPEGGVTIVNIVARDPSSPGRRSRILSHTFREPPEELIEAFRFIADAIEEQQKENSVKTKEGQNGNE